MDSRGTEERPSVPSGRVRLRPRLINGKHGDPGLLVGLEGSGESVLVDCGDLRRVSKKQLLRVRHVFVSHTHIDHWIGFDRLLRHNLAHEALIHVHGPEGIIGHVRGKIAGYLWNLQEAGPTFVCHEVGRDRVRTQSLPGRLQFRPEGPPKERELRDGVLWDDGRIKVCCAQMEHRGPTLAYSLEEAPFLAVRKERLRELGVRPGAWVARLKEAVLSGVSRGSVFDLEGREWRLGNLVDDLLEFEEGRRIAYVTDTVYNRRTERAVARLAERADPLYCEANFREEDADKARLTAHLTATQAGRLARAASARRLVLFHISRKYSGDHRSSVAEASRVFENVE